MSCHVAVQSIYERRHFGVLVVFCMTMSAEHRAPIISIARHRIVLDGKGVNTLVLFKGCSLRCRYCLNPYTWDNQTPFTWQTAQQLYNQVKIDNIYFLATGGGITFGGGEPCLQSAFIDQFRRICGTHWQINVETSLNISQSHLKKLLPVVNHYYVDIKEMNNTIYKQYTGRTNKQVISNLHWIIAQGKADAVIVRVPHIPDFNTAKDIEQSVAQLSAMGLSNFDQFNYIIPNQ